MTAPTEQRLLLSLLSIGLVSDVPLFPIAQMLVVELSNPVPYEAPQYSISIKIIIARLSDEYKMKRKFYPKSVFI